MLSALRLSYLWAARGDYEVALANLRASRDWRRRHGVDSLLEPGAHPKALELERSHRGLLKYHISGCAGAGGRGGPLVLVRVGAWDLGALGNAVAGYYQQRQFQDEQQQQRPKAAPDPDPPSALPGLVLGHVVTNELLAQRAEEAVSSSASAAEAHSAEAHLSARALSAARPAGGAQSAGGGGDSTAPPLASRQLRPPRTTAVLDFRGVDSVSLLASTSIHSFFGEVLLVHYLGHLPSATT